MKSFLKGAIKSLFTTYRSLTRISSPEQTNIEQNSGLF